MEKIILHRNYGSPYCQKIIAMLGYCKLDWFSELTSKGMPRPTQEILAGNYSRRVPILQIGSDIYCDTKEICHQIAEISGNKVLSYYHLTEEQQVFSDQLEFEFGKAVMGLLNPIEIITSYFKHIPIKDAYEFIVDRLQVKKRTKGKNPLEEKSKDEWKSILIYYLKMIDGILENHQFLSENSVPSYVDLTAYTHVWYSYRLNHLKYAKGLPNIKKWLKRMDSFDIGNYKELAKNEVINIALASEPKLIDSSFLNATKLNEETSVVVNDELAFIMNPVNGVLVGKDSKKTILERRHSKIGKVHIHVPLNCHGACG
ncbi:glutathione S-transferase [uncultured Tenacibaculum sp.]|uniref:glutathione S-transferase n=1 Tax=uncultured Tenacibaculum sp. TaxID=174713 RepID=UPI0026389DCB|nr:glutathione S-transferase [uncultured Tenacibaculum sp.]